MEREMNALIITDRKPDNCEECVFLDEVMTATESPNHFELVPKCFIGCECYDKCELIVIKDLEMLEKKLKNGKENL